MRRQHGFTLIEIAIALAVLAIVTGAALAAVQGYTRRAQLNRAVEEIDVLAKASAQWPSISGRPDFAGLTKWELNNRGLISPRLTDGDANPWRCAYEVGEWSREPPRFYVWMNCVPGWAPPDLANIFRRRAECCWYDGNRIYLAFY